MKGTKYGTIIEELENRLIELKKEKAMQVFSQLALEPDKILLNDDLWALIRNQFMEEEAEALTRFFSTFIYQTGKKSINCEYFVFNIIAAANKKKFGLREFLFTYPINIITNRKEIEQQELVCKHLRSFAAQELCHSKASTLINAHSEEEDTLNLPSLNNTNSFGKINMDEIRGIEKDILSASKELESTTLRDKSSRKKEPVTTDSTAIDTFDSGNFYVPKRLKNAQRGSKCKISDYLRKEDSRSTSILKASPSLSNSSESEFRPKLKVHIDNSEVDMTLFDIGSLNGVSPIQSVEKNLLLEFYESEKENINSHPRYRVNGFDGDSLHGDLPVKNKKQHKSICRTLKKGIEGNSSQVRASRNLQRICGSSRVDHNLSKSKLKRKDKVHSKIGRSKIEDKSSGKKSLKPKLKIHMNNDIFLIN